MPSPKQPDSRAVLRKVLALVILLPLLVSLVRLPLGLAMVVSLAAIAASAYGFWFAVRNARGWLVMFAGVMTLLNFASLIALASPSVLKGLFSIAWVYGYSYFSNWAYWNF